MTTENKKWSIGANEVGYEADTEDGPCTRYYYFLSAINDDGLVYHHYHCFTNPDEAEALVRRVEAASDWVGPVVSRYWTFNRAAYGSPAYARNWRLYEAQTELAEREPELGPQGAFNSLPDCMKAALA